MGEPIKVFFCEPTKKYTQELRRYSNDRACIKDASKYSYCNASVYLTTFESEPQPVSGDDINFEGDPRWPKHCERCSQPFFPEDHFQVNYERIYRRIDTGEEMTLRLMPVGACWNAFWMTDRGHDVGFDGRSLVCRVPGGYDWMIDGGCSNCTKPDDDIHKCWVRHGKPEDETIHVDKNGNTCSAGGGSIDTGKWHGFLHNGYLVG